MDPESNTAAGAFLPQVRSYIQGSAPPKLPWCCESHHLFCSVWNRWGKETHAEKSDDGDGNGPGVTIAWSREDGMSKWAKQIWQIDTIEFGDRLYVGGERGEVSSDCSVVFMKQPALEEKQVWRGDDGLNSRHTLNLRDQWGRTQVAIRCIVLRQARFALGMYKWVMNMDITTSYKLRRFVLLLRDSRRGNHTGTVRNLGEELEKNSVMVTTESMCVKK